MKIKTLLLVLFITVLPVALFGVSNKSVAAHGIIGGTEDENDELADKIHELEDKIKEYEEKIKSLQNKEQSLQKEIEYADSQIGLTETRIQQSIAQISKKQKEIVKLADDIEELGQRIDKLMVSIDYQQDVLSERLRARYKSRETTPMVVIFGSSTINSIIQKTEYLKVMEKQDQKLLDEMRSTREAFSLQKGLFEDKKEREEELKVQLEVEKGNLESYKSDLNRQKKDKEVLLEETQNDESRYQALLAQVQSELAALQLAIDLPAGDGEEVERGDVIGFMGNTGCSSGPHVHFGYVESGKSKDPLPRLQNGDLKWPVDNYQITQYFGENYTFYMNNFGIPGHDALDIISTSQWSGAPIRAAEDGVLYYAQDAKVYCPWLNNSIGKGAIIDHGDGKRTIYWHLQ